MKPITEDQVLSLMKGVEAREKSARRRLSNSVQHLESGGQMTARVLKYTPIETDDRELPSSCAHPVALDKVRAARKARRAVQGYFFYTLGAGPTSA
jgi:hypothetical protein